MREHITVAARLIIAQETGGPDLVGNFESGWVDLLEFVRLQRKRPALSLQSARGRGGGLFARLYSTANAHMQALIRAESQSFLSVPRLQLTKSARRSQIGMSRR
jgi:hypothetical protein